jgi:hypothetical protein
MHEVDVRGEEALKGIVSGVLRFNLHVPFLGRENKRIYILFIFKSLQTFKKIDML